MIPLTKKSPTIPIYQERPSTSRSPKRLFFTTELIVAMVTYGAIEYKSKEKDECLSRSPKPLTQPVDEAAATGG